MITQGTESHSPRAQTPQSTGHRVCVKEYDCVRVLILAGMQGGSGKPAQGWRPRKPTRTWIGTETSPARAA